MNDFQNFMQAALDNNKLIADELREQDIIDIAFDAIREFSLNVE